MADLLPFDRGAAVLRGRPELNVIQARRRLRQIELAGQAPCAPWKPRPFPPEGPRAA